MERIGICRFPGPCRVSVTGTGLMSGKEKSPVPGLEVSPSAEYLDMCGKAGKVPHREAAEHPHIILAVSKESENPLDVCFPFQMTVTGLYQ